MGFSLGNLGINSSSLSINSIKDKLAGSLGGGNLTSIIKNVDFDSLKDAFTDLKDGNKTIIEVLASKLFGM